MAEDVAGLQAQNCGLWTSRVGAPNPEDLGGLALTELLEEFGF